MPKLSRVLRPGGWVVLWWTLFRDPTRPDPFHDATRHLVEQRATNAEASDHLPFELDVGGWETALTARGNLGNFNARLIHWTASLDARQIRALYASMINIRRRAPREREAILDELVSVAESNFGGIVHRPFVTAVYAARKT